MIKDDDNESHNNSSKHFFYIHLKGIQRRKKNRVLKGLDAPKDKNPLFQFKCQCSVCLKNTARKAPTPPTQSLLQSQNESDFAFILRRLVPPIIAKQQYSSLRILIPETIFFVSGEPKFLVHTQYDKTADTLFIKLVKQKEKLTFLQIRKYLNERRKNRGSLAVGDELPPIEANQVSFNGLTSEQNKQFDLVYEQHMQKLRSKISSSVDRGSNIVNPNLLKIQLLKDLKQKWAQELQNEKITKEAVICQYNDSKAFMNIIIENSQILSEHEFLNLTVKRKEDPIWSTINFLQNYIKVSASKYEKVQQSQFITKFNLQGRFEFGKDSRTELFARAKIEVNILNGEISRLSEDFITKQQEIKFESELQSLNFFEYLKYQIYKIVHFIESFYSIRIQKGLFEWLKDNNNQFCLVNAHNVKHFNVTIDDYYKRLEQDAEKKLMNSHIPPEKLQSAYQNQTISMIEEQMYFNYEKARNQVGIKIQVQNQTANENSSEEAFQYLHPQLQSTLSQLLTSDQPIQKLYEQYIWTEKQHRIHYQSTASTKMFDLFLKSPPIKKKSRAPIQTINRSTFTRTKHTLIQQENSFTMQFFPLQSPKTSSQFDFNFFNLNSSYDQPQTSYQLRARNKKNTLPYYIFANELESESKIQ